MSSCTSSLMRLAIQQTAPITPTPTRELRIDPRIELAPTRGYAGAYLSVQGDGWTPGQMIVITMQDVQGDSSVLAAATVDTDGRLASGFLYPLAERWLRPGAKTIVAASADGALSATADFMVEPPDGVVAVVTDAPAEIDTPTATPTLTATPTITPTITTTATPASTVTTAPSTTPAVQRPRPFENGVFLAPPSTGVNLDADLSLWTNGWIPVQSVAFGAENYGGPADLSGEFQVLWSPDGLYLAVRVRDDAYRSGPPGTDMWQGDSIEIHFDRQLGADYADAAMSADDYQIGIGFGLQLNAVTGYRWFPENEAGAILVAGAVRPTEQGYEAELLIPWSVFDVEPAEVTADATFGFNLSLSDNDGDAPSQQTILSASPARTNHRTPPEWGTLILRAE
ncbi:MAG: sugar-binding protein [Caldilineaceae bacterium]